MKERYNPFGILLQRCQSGKQAFLQILLALHGLLPNAVNLYFVPDLLVRVQLRRPLWQEEYPQFLSVRPDEITHRLGAVKAGVVHQHDQRPLPPLNQALEERDEHHAVDVSLFDRVPQVALGRDGRQDVEPAPFHAGLDDGGLAPQPPGPPVARHDPHPRLVLERDVGPELCGKPLYFRVHEL